MASRARLSGSRWEKGGYITRGFQDLKWLTYPPVAGVLRTYLRLNRGLRREDDTRQGDHNGHYHFNDESAVVSSARRGRRDPRERLVRKGKVRRDSKRARRNQSASFVNEREIVRADRVLDNRHEVGHMARRERTFTNLPAWILQDGRGRHDRMGRRLAAPSGARVQ